VPRAHALISRRPWLLATMTAAVATAGLPLVPASAGVTAQATKVQVSSTAPGQATVTWSAADTSGVRDWEVVLSVSDADGSTSRWLFASPSARQLVVNDLPAGATIAAAVVVYTGTGITNWSAATPSIVVNSGLCAGSRGDCVAIDGSSPVAPEQHVAQGFLHGIDTLTPTGVSEVQALSPRWWRITESSTSEWQALKAFPSVATTALLSDAWHAWTNDPLTGRAESPWDDWTKYANFISSQVQQRVAAGQVPAYWEIQNEPDVHGYYSLTSPPTEALLLKQYAVAYNAIKAVLPNAQIIGPSLSSFLLVGDSTHLGLQDFIDYATANNLQFAAVSWHEIGAATSTAPSLNLPGLIDRVQQVRTLLNQSPVLAAAQIFVNEFDSAQTSQLVGWDLGHVTALEQAGVDEANHACWAGCSTGDVVGELLGSDGQTPQMTYWGRKVYAGMTGQRMSAVSTAHDTTVLAANGGSAGSVTSIISRHHGCSAPSNRTACPPRLFQPPVDSGPLTAVLRLPAPPKGFSSSKATVTVTRLDNTMGNQLAMPSPILNTVVDVGSDRIVRTSLASLADGGAYALQIAWVAGP